MVRCLQSSLLQVEDALPGSKKVTGSGSEVMIGGKVRHFALGVITHDDNFTAPDLNITWIGISDWTVVLSSELLIILFQVLF